MYCSKLIWNTFINLGIDLDSNRTTSRLFGERDGFDFGWVRENPVAWIGASPDDLYYSQRMGKDIIIAGQENLSYPLEDSVF